MRIQQAFRHTALLAALLAAFALSGCAATAPKQQVAAYLEEARDDFITVRKMVADNDINGSEEGEDEDDVSPEEQRRQIEEIMQRISDYKTQVERRADLIQKRDTMGLPELESFASSGLRCLQLSSDVLDEYAQIGNYFFTLMEMSSTLAAFGTLDNMTAQQFDAMYAEVENTIAALQSEDVPSFLQSANQDMIEMLQELLDATTYLVNAVALDDPVRMDAGLYRYGILTRRTVTVTSSAMADIERRRQKIKSDFEEIARLESGLTEWIDANMGMLDPAKEA